MTKEKQVWLYNKQVGTSVKKYAIETISYDCNKTPIR